MYRLVISPLPCRLLIPACLHTILYHLLLLHITSQSSLFLTTLSKSIDFFPFPKNPQEISPSHNSTQIRYKKNKREILTRSPPSQGERSLTCFFVPDLRRIIQLYVRGRSPWFFIGKGKKSIDLESVVFLARRPDRIENCGNSSGCCCCVRLLIPFSSYHLSTNFGCGGCEWRAVATAVAVTTRGCFGMIILHPR